MKHAAVPLTGDTAAPTSRQSTCYRFDGTTTLFAAMSALDGTVIGQCMARHRHQEFIRFL